MPSLTLRKVYAIPPPMINASTLSIMLKMSWILSLTCRNGGGAGVDGGGEQPRVGDGEGRREGVGWRDLGAAEDREHRPCRHIDHLGKGVQLLEHEGSRRPDCKAFAQHRRVAAVGRAKRVVDVNVCELPEMRLERLDLCSVGLDLFAVLFSLARLLDVHPQVLEQNDRAGRRVRAHLLNLPASERRAPVHGGGAAVRGEQRPPQPHTLSFPSSSKTPLANRTGASNFVLSTSKTGVIENFSSKPMPLGRPRCDIRTTDLAPFSRANLVARRTAPTALRALRVRGCPERSTSRALDGGQCGIDTSGVGDLARVLLVLREDGACRSEGNREGGWGGF